MNKRVKFLRQVAIILGAFFFMLAYKYGTPDNELPAQPPSPVSVMFNQHKCWTNDGRVHPRPSSVVLVDNTGRPSFSHNVDHALNVVLFGKGSLHGLTVVGFCE